MKPNYLLTMTLLLGLSMFMQAKGTPQSVLNIVPNNDNVIFVDEQASDGQSGTDWDHAASFRDALVFINEGSGEDYQIWMSYGTYQTEGLAFHIKNNIKIYGGFDRGLSLEDRNGSLQKKTVLKTKEGDKNRVLIIARNNTDEIAVTLDSLVISGGTAHDIVDGYTMTADARTTKYRGGGIFIGTADVVLQYITVCDNVAENKDNLNTYGQSAKGGGIYTTEAKLTMINCELKYNTSTYSAVNGGSGGGLYVYNSITDIRDCRIEGNASTYGAETGAGGGISYYNTISNRNSWHAIKSSIIQNNIAKAGDSEKKEEVTGKGGGIYIFSQYSTVTIESSHISNNMAVNTSDNNGFGGGIYLNSGILTIGEMVIEGNIATCGGGAGSGGGIYAESGTKELTIENTYILKNSAIKNNQGNGQPGLGGGIYNNNRGLRIRNTKIEGNIATSGNGNGFGGGLYSNSSSALTSLEKSDVLSNFAVNNEASTSNGGGGGLYINGGELEITERLILENIGSNSLDSPGQGGGIRLISGDLSIKASEISFNKATTGTGFGYGGGVSTISDGNVSLINTLISKNSAGIKGLGGGLFNERGRSVILTNVTIAGNSAGSSEHGGGGGIYNYENGLITLQNTIIWSNEMDDLSIDGSISLGSLKVVEDGESSHGYSLVKGFENDKGDSPEMCGISNSDSNYPLFVDPENNNYRLCMSSPILGLADKLYLGGNNTDLEGNYRGDEVELGAYESVPIEITLSEENKFQYNISNTYHKKDLKTKSTGDELVYWVTKTRSFQFEVIPDKGYVGGLVHVNGEQLLASSGNTYIIPNVMSDQYIEVKGFYAEPGIPPVPDYFNVVLPEVKGITLSVEPGKYPVEKGRSFDFSFSLNDGYRMYSDPLVTTNRNETLSPVESNNTYNYKIENITEAIEVYISGIREDIPSHIADIDEPVKVYTESGCLFIENMYSSQTTIYTVSGQLYMRKTLPEGLTMIQMSSGVYFIRINDKVYKIVI